MRTVTINCVGQYDPNINSVQWYRFTMNDQDKITRIEQELYNQGGVIWMNTDGEAQFIKILNHVLSFNEADTLTMLSQLVKE